MTREELAYARAAVGAGKQIPGTAMYVDVCHQCGTTVQSKSPWMVLRDGTPVLRRCDECRLGSRVISERKWVSRRGEGRGMVKRALGRSVILARK